MAKFTQAFTPGPWRITRFGAREYEINGRDGNEWGIASVNVSDGLDEPTMFPAEANANLIAAAPEMYEALNECVKVLALLPVDRSQSWVKAACERGLKAVGAGRAALAKADGKAVQS